MNPVEDHGLRTRVGRQRVGLGLLALAVALLAFAATAQAKTVAAGESQSCGIFANGALKCWGSDSSNGALGTGTTRDDTPDPQPVAGMASGVTDVDYSVTGGGGTTGCAIVNGAARCWGNNNLGQFGNGTDGNSSPAPVPVTGLGSGVTEISVSGGHACAVQNGAAKCWGSGSYGKLGVDNDADQLTPVTPIGLEGGVTDITTGTSHTCAIQSTVVKCWGDEGSGGLGRPVITNNEIPLAVEDQPFPAAEIAAGYRTSCMSTVGGAAYCWGSNSDGKLGTGNNDSGGTDPRPVVGLGSGVTDISGKSAHFCAVKSGTGFCWGRGTNGQLGNGAGTSSNAPVAVQSLIGVTSIDAGNNHSCASIGSSQYCWGTNGRNQLGIPVAEASSSLVPVNVGGSDPPPDGRACKKAERKLDQATKELKRLQKKGASKKKIKKAKEAKKKAKAQVRKACA